MAVVRKGGPRRASVITCCRIMCSICSRVQEACEGFVTGGLPGVSVGGQAFMCTG